MSTPPPSNLRALQEQYRLEVVWSDGSTFQLPYKFLRGECPCAACVDEDTGIRILDITTISETIQPTQMSFTGNYALKIHWSDEHDTGLYTWKHLQKLCENDEAIPVSTDQS